MKRNLTKFLKIRLTKSAIRTNIILNAAYQWHAPAESAIIMPIQLTAVPMGAVMVPVTVQVPEAATQGVKGEYPRSSGLVGNRPGRKTDDRNERTQSLIQTLS